MGRACAMLTVLMVGLTDPAMSQTDASVNNGVCPVDTRAIAKELLKAREELTKSAKFCDYLVETENQENEKALAACEARDNIDRTTNAALNERLKACEASMVDPEELQALQAEITDLKEQLAKSEAARSDAESRARASSVQREEVAALQSQLAEARSARAAAEGDRDEALAKVETASERLDEVGVTLEPSYSYVGDPFSSFLRSDSATAIIDPTAQLEAKRCAEALEWLAGQSDGARRLSLSIWVWEGGRSMLCESAPDGSPQLFNPTPADEAHYILYR